MADASVGVANMDLNITSSSTPTSATDKAALPPQAPQQDATHPTNTGSTPAASRAIVSGLALINAFRANDYPRARELITQATRAHAAAVAAAAAAATPSTTDPSASPSASASSPSARFANQPVPPYGSPLHLAVTFSPVAVVRQLFADFRPQIDAVWINARNSPAAQTPLHIACSLGNKDVIPLLLAVDKLDDTALDAQGQSAIDIAASRASSLAPHHKYAAPSSAAQQTAAYIHQLLVDHQRAFSARVEDVIVRNLRKGTPEFIIASFGTDQRFISYLHLRLININVPYNPQTRQTILHFAAQKDDLALCNWALQQGADAALKDVRGKRPIDYCAKGSSIYNRFLNFIDQTPIISKSLTQASITGKQPIEAPVMKGSLLKWVNLALGYKPRYFVLEDGHFGYYKSEADYPGACRSMVDTALIQVTLPDADDKSRFDVITKGSITISMKAASAVQAKQWVWALMESKKYSQDQRKNHANFDVTASTIDENGGSVGTSAMRHSDHASADGSEHKYASSSEDDEDEDDDFSESVVDELKSPRVVNAPLPRLSVVDSHVSSSGVSGGALSPGTSSPLHSGSYAITSAGENGYHSSVVGGSAVSAVSNSNPRRGTLALIRHTNRNTKIGKLSDKLFATLDVLDQAVTMHKDLLQLLPVTVEQDRENAVQSSDEVVQVIDDVVGLVQRLETLWKRKLARERKERKQVEAVLGRVVELGNEDVPLEPMKPDEDLGNSPLEHGFSSDGNISEEEEEEEAAYGGSDSEDDSMEFYDATDGAAAAAVAAAAAISAGDSSSIGNKSAVVLSPNAVSQAITTASSSGNSTASLIGKHRRHFSMSILKHHMEDIGYPSAPRSVLPLDPSIPPPKLQIWSFLKSAFGKDLSRLTLPVHFNEPLSMLQRLAEDIQDAYMLNKASRISDPALRILCVGGFAISNYSTTVGRTGKPFNPVLGETYEYCGKDTLSKADGDSPVEWRYLSEQVCHHPPISACHASSKYFTYWAEVNMLSKFWGKSLQLLPQGANYATLTLPDGTVEKYCWKKVTTTVHNLVVGKLWLDHSGDMIIKNLTKNIELRIEFVPNAGWFSNTNIEGGELKGEVVGTSWKVKGNWASHLNAVNTERSQEVEIWKSTTKYKREYFNLTEFAIGLNELDANNKLLTSNLPLSDCRRRKDQREMERGNYDLANEEKTRIENLQRKRRAELMAVATPVGPPYDGDPMGEKWWIPRWFIRRGDQWIVREEYWNRDFPYDIDLFGTLLPN